MLCGIGDERLPFARGARRKNLALVRHLEVEHRKERLGFVGAIAPVRARAEIVPDRERHAELVIGLRAVARVVAGRAQIFGKRLHVVRRHREVRPRQLWHAIFRRPHVLRADRRLIHARDDGRAAWRAHRRRRKRALVADGFARQAIEHRRAGQRIAIGADVRAHVFVRDPDDVRAHAWCGRILCGSGTRHRGKHQKRDERPACEHGHHHFFSTGG